jgi:DNA polymerase
MALEDGVLKPLRERVLCLLESDVQEVWIEPSKGEGTVCPAEGARAASDETSPEEGLERIREEIGECNRCPLARSRKNLVFGEGNARAEILFIGEGPGGEEDETGRPFVGPAGQLLTQIIERGMGISRPSVYICNIVKCRPPGNRTPLDEEAEGCLPFLVKQIEVVRPKVIVSLGHSATSRLLRVRGPMHQLRGKWHDYRGIPVMPTFHPSYVLRYYTVEIRKQVWEDVREAMRLLRDLQGGASL